MKDRETIRKEVLDMSNANLLLMLPTGTGKTSIALDVAFTRVPICPKILIVVPKNSIKSSWEDEIERCGYEEDMDNITIGNWKVYSDNGSNNLLFLYNNMLKFTMTPAGNMIASDYTERD